MKMCLQLCVLIGEMWLATDSCWMYAPYLYMGLPCTRVEHCSSQYVVGSLIHAIQQLLEGHWMETLVQHNVCSGTGRLALIFGSYITTGIPFGLAVNRAEESHVKWVFSSLWLVSHEWNKRRLRSIGCNLCTHSFLIPHLKFQCTCFLILCSWLLALFSCQSCLVFTSLMAAQPWMGSDVQSLCSTSSFFIIIIFAQAWRNNATNSSDERDASKCHTQLRCFLADIFGKIVVEFSQATAHKHNKSLKQFLYCSFASPFH